MIFSNKFGFILETVFSYVLIMFNKVGVTIYQKGHRSQARKLGFARPRGLQRVE
jgi:hypothetical protein